MNNSAAHMIQTISAQDTGGGCTCDLITLNDGRLICISVDGIGLYESEDAFHNCGGAMAFINENEMSDEDSNWEVVEDRRTSVGYYIRTREQGEVRNGQPAEFLTLGNGAFLCIDDTGAGLYKNRTAFNEGHSDSGLGFLDFSTAY